MAMLCRFTACVKPDAESRLAHSCQENNCFLEEGVVAGSVFFMMSVVCVQQGACGSNSFKAQHETFAFCEAHAEEISFSAALWGQQLPACPGHSKW
jgi:hypothetical protein